MTEKLFDRERLLLDAALDEFSQKNFDEASINRILKNAGISKGVFYYHFQDKEALYLHLMGETSRLKWEFIAGEMSHANLVRVDIFEQFRFQAQAGIRFAMQYPKYHRFAWMIAKEKNPTIRAHIETAFAQSDKLEEMVSIALKSGDFSEVYSKNFLITVISFLFAHFDDIFPDDREAYENLDSYIAMMKNGLSAK